MSTEWQIALFGIGCTTIGWFLNTGFTYLKEKKQAEDKANSEREDFENELLALIKGEVRRNLKENVSKSEYDFLIRVFSLRELGQTDPINYGYRSKNIVTEKFDELRPKINKYNSTILEQHNGNEVVGLYEFLEEFYGDDVIYLNDVSPEKANYYKEILQYFENVFGMYR
ncbi:hypothetical protein [Kurthia massiliensis]|uniref:hypothetical protein n=1 Tax=Kurthia massiliensis TaxID=1033739 RepID=UPI000288A69D|nr:hypothetical protein [Kurthia massiliensis]